MRWSKVEQEYKPQTISGVSTNKLSRAWTVLFSLPKSLYFNLKCLPFTQAVKMPFLISHRIQIVEAHKNIIALHCPIRRFMIRVGFGGSVGIVSRKGLISIESGTVIFNGKAIFSEGIALRNCGVLSFGENFMSNTNMYFSIKNSTLMSSTKRQSVNL